MASGMPSPGHHNTYNSSSSKQYQGQAQGQLQGQKQSAKAAISSYDGGTHVIEDGDRWSALTAPALPSIYSNGECPNTSGSASGGSQYFVFGFAMSNPNKRCHDREDVLLCYHILNTIGDQYDDTSFTVLKGRCMRSLLSIEGLQH